MDERRQCPECRVDVGADDSACSFCGTVLKKTPRPSARCGGWAQGQRPALEACPDCGAMISPRAQSCPHCGCPARGKQRPARPAGGTVASALIVAFAVTVMLNVASANRRGAKVPPSSPRVVPGDRAVLACKGGDGAYVAFGIEAWSRMAHAQVRRDSAEMHRLVDTGRIALIADGTPVEVAGSSVMALRIRVLAGPHQGREGWVRREFVRAAGPRAGGAKPAG